MPREGLTIAEVSELLTMMSVHGVTDLTFGGLQVKRSPEPTSTSRATGKTEDELLNSMQPEAIDRMLMLRRTRNMSGGT